MSSFRDLQSSIRRHGAPVSAAFVGVLVVSFLAIYSQAVNPSLLVFSILTIADRPWTSILWPLASIDFLGVVFGGLWMWSVGGMVERETGSKRFAALLFAFILASSAFVYLGSVITRVNGWLMGPYAVLAMVTVIWGTRYPNQEVRFMFVLNIAAKWVAWISTGLVFFSTPPQLAPFAVIPLALAHFFAAGKLGIAYSGGAAPKKKKADLPTYGRTGKVDRNFLDDVNQRAREREERERLRKLFESSMIDNTTEDDRDAR